MTSTTLQQSHTSHPHQHHSSEDQPISRTYQYRKVMKPMLERKRRARINRCLDELKELLVGALQAEGETVSRLEKADVLELTVRHLHKLKRATQLSEAAQNEKYRSGFIHCTNEVSKWLTISSSSSSFEVSFSNRLLSHLESCIGRIDASSSTQCSSFNSNISSSILSPNKSISSNNQVSIINYTPPSSPVLAQHSLISTIKNPNRTIISNSHSEEPYDLSNTSVWRPW